MEFSKKKLPKVDSFRGFIGKLKCNPMTKEKIVVAKDSSYPYQKSEDAYVLLLPLAVKNVYMYVQPYIDAKTNVTEHCLRIGRITDLSLSDNSQIYVYNGSAQNDIRFNKGVRYVQFLADYFDAEKNKMLYKVSKANRMVCEKKTKHDTDKIQHRDRCGYVEIQHLRLQNEGSSTNYIQLLCVKSYKGERQPAQVSVLLEEEWKYVSRYLNFVISFYKLDAAGTIGGLQKKRIETARRDVMEVIGKIGVEANKKKDKANDKTSSDGNKEGTDENKSDNDIKRGKVSNKEGSSSSRKRKLTNNDDVKLRKSCGEDSSIDGKDEVDRDIKDDDVVDNCVESSVEKKVNDAVASSKKRKLLTKSKKNDKLLKKDGVDEAEQHTANENDDCGIEKELSSSIKEIQGRESEAIEIEQDNEYDDNYNDDEDNENNSEVEMDGSDYEEEYE